MLTTESATRAEDVLLRKWVPILFDLLDLTGKCKLHIHMVSNFAREGCPKEGIANMCPIPAPGNLFFMEISSTKPELILPALCHETVHVDQVVRGDNIIDPTSGYAYWKGKGYNSYAVCQRANKDKDFYLNLPWEKEAHEKMWILADLVKRKVK
jgi:hypothetical protein